MDLNLHIYLHLPSGTITATSLDTKLNTLLERTQQLMTISTDIRAAMTQLATDVDNYIAVGQAAVASLHQQLDDAIAAKQQAIADAQTATDMDAADKAALQAALDELEALKETAVDITNALSAVDAKVTTTAAQGGTILPPVVPPITT